MQIGQHLATAVMGLVLMSPATGQEMSSTAPSVAAQSLRVRPSAPAGTFGMDVPLEYYNLSFTLSKRTGGITPPVQARIFAYMGLALYEALVGGVPPNRSVAKSVDPTGRVAT